MLTDGERNLLLTLIELIGTEWKEKERPEDIRLSSTKIGALLGVNALVNSQTSALTPEVLREKCPAFCEVYQQVMLRELEEQIANGPANP